MPTSHFWGLRSWWMMSVFRWLVSGHRLVLYISSAKVQPLYMARRRVWLARVIIGWSGRTCLCRGNRFVERNALSARSGRCGVSAECGANRKTAPPSQEGVRVRVDSEHGNLWAATSCCPGPPTSGNCYCRTLWGSTSNSNTCVRLRFVYPRVSACAEFTIWLMISCQEIDPAPAGRICI